MNKTQFVAISDPLSWNRNVRSGVTQNFVLCFQLFLSYDNYLPLNITSSIRFFTDDCCIQYKETVNMNYIVILQSDLKNLFFCGLESGSHQRI